MRRTSIFLLALGLVAGLLGPASAGSGLKRLGTDPAGDGPAALDVTYLDVGRNGDALEIRIGVEGMFPAIGGYPELPGIEWIFTVKGRTFIAEGVAGRNARFFLFEETDSGYTQLQSPEGTYNSDDGYIMMLVPLKTIGAKKGTVIAGVPENDVDAHVHIGPQTEYPDVMTTTKKYKVR